MLTLSHEGYGGHLLQSVYNGANDIGKLRRVMSIICYGEGFSDYGAARLMAASDFDAVILAAAIVEDTLDSVMSARVEIGIYYEGWTEKEVARYFQKIWGLGDDILEDESFKEFAKSIYEYSFATAGTICRYGVGVAFFNNLRYEAETAFSEGSRLWENFDEIEYHKAILDIGPCPLNILEEMLGLGD
jgi:uncharacterized protein (DUF885 family)